MLAHHGSIAREQRLQIEEELKAGGLPALVATSSLELGIDMGAIDLVVQIEAPPSVAAGLQRIGRAGHQVGEPSSARSSRTTAATCSRRPWWSVACSTGDRGDAHPPQPAGRAGPAAGGHWHDDAWTVDALHALGDPRRAVPRPVAAAARGRARHALRPIPIRRVRRAEAAGRVGSPGGHHPSRNDARVVAVISGGPSPTAACSASSWPATKAARAGASASWTRRWCTRAASARSSCWEPRPGGSRRSGRPGDRLARARAARQDAVLAGRRPRPPRRARAGDRRLPARDRAGWSPQRQRHACATTTPSTSGRPQPARLPRRAARGDRRPATDRRWWSSGSATSSATGESACCRRSAAASTPRGRWPSRRASRSRASGADDLDR